jgi:hypothetical protein
MLGWGAMQQLTSECAEDVDVKPGHHMAGVPPALDHPLKGVHSQPH